VGGNQYCDTTLPFGFRHGSAICQRVTDAIRHILKKHGITIVNYIDDFIGIVPASRATEMFKPTRNKLESIDLALSNSKTVLPAHECNYLGININTSTFTLAIPREKLKNIIGLCRQFYAFNKLRKQQIQSILGSLIFLHKAIIPARLFVNRVIALLKIAPDSGFIHIRTLRLRV
jgi:hypothetical protein